MGVDLTLLPVYSKGSWLCHNMVELNRRSELWPEFEKVTQIDVPEPIISYLATGEDGESKYGDVLEDPYGDRLKWTTAGNLMQLKDHPTIQDCWQNRGIWAWLAEMPEDWPVVLYWH